MKIDMEKFPTITALLATTGVGACTVNNNSTNGGTGGSGGEATGGADSGTGGKGTGGSGGTSTGGTSGSGGTATGGTSSDAGPDASKADAGGEGTLDGATDSGKTDAGGEGGACLGDTAPPWTPPDAGALGDAGTEGLDRCALLPASDQWCQPDAGGEGYWAYGYSLCSVYALTLRPGVADAITTCIEQVPATNPCGSSYEAAILGCFDAAVAKVCPQVLPSSGDAGADLCDAVTAGCSGVTATQCRQVLSSFSDESLIAVEACLTTPSGDAGACAADFWNCVLPFGVTR